MFKSLLELLGCRRNSSAVDRGNGLLIMTSKQPSGSGVTMLPPSRRCEAAVF
jgi:hypothetical protein